MKRLTFILLVLMVVNVFGQQKPFPLRVALINEATAIPYTRFLTLPIDEFTMTKEAMDKIISTVVP